MLFLFAFIADSALLDDIRERTRLQSMMSNLFHLFSITTSRVFRSQDDLADIRQRLDVFANDAVWLQGIVDEHTNGKKFDVEKMHKFFGIIYCILSKGCSQNASTNHFEEALSSVKEAVSHLHHVVNIQVVDF